MNKVGPVNVNSYKNFSSCLSSLSLSLTLMKAYQVSSIPEAHRITSKQVLVSAVINMPQIRCVYRIPLGEWR